MATSVINRLAFRLKRSLFFSLFLIIILSFTLSVFALVNQNHVQFNGIKNYLQRDDAVQSVQVKKVHQLRLDTSPPKHRKMVQFYPDNQVRKHDIVDHWDTLIPPTVQAVKENVSSVSDGVHVFYYAWYGNQKQDGKWYHWNHEYLPNWDKTDKRVFPQGRHNVSNDDIGSNFYPELGLYSSSDQEVIAAHCKMIRDAHIGVIVVSWYPPTLSDPNGPAVDQLIPMLLDVAAHYGLKITFHIEPYQDRDPENVRENVKYIVSTYGSHAAFYRRNGRPLFYIYDSYLSPAKDWKRMLTTIRGTHYDSYFIALLVEYKHRFSISEAGFDGFYTYFGSNGFSYGANWKNWRALQSFARKQNLLFIPSLSPGYVDTRIRPWNTQTTRSRRQGAYYDLSWRSFEELKGLKIVSITSFNEWHEGTQIEPASKDKRTLDGNYTYQSYSPHSPDFYLLKTKEWIEKLFIKTLKSNSL